MHSGLLGPSRAAPESENRLSKFSQGHRHEKPISLRPGFRTPRIQRALNCIRFDCGWSSEGKTQEFASFTISAVNETTAWRRQYGETKETIFVCDVTQTLRENQGADYDTEGLVAPPKTSFGDPLITIKEFAEILDRR